MGATALLVARMGSSRLPGKSLMPVGGRPMVERMIDRVERAASVDRIVLATSTRGEDDALAKLADQRGVDCFRGSPDDVLSRLHGAAEAFGGDPVLQLLGDNPLVHGTLIDEVVAFHGDGRYDYAVSATNEFPIPDAAFPKFPIGVRVEVIGSHALDRCHELAHAPEDREHSTTFIAHHPDLFRVGYFPASGKWERVKRPELTFAVNYRENYELIARIFELAYAVDRDFDLATAIAAFDTHPELHSLMGTPAAVA